MNQSRPHNLTLRYCLCQSTFFLSCAGIFGFAVTYLLKKGFQTAEIGMMIAASNFLSCIVQPFLGDFADRFPKIRLTSMIAVCLLCCFLCFATIQMCRPPLSDKHVSANGRGQPQCGSRLGNRQFFCCSFDDDV